jgi:hypothetical protein
VKTHIGLVKVLARTHMSLESGMDGAENVTNLM